MVFLWPSVHNNHNHRGCTPRSLLVILNHYDHHKGQGRDCMQIMYRSMSGLLTMVYLFNRLQECQAGALMR